MPITTSRRTVRTAGSILGAAVVLAACANLARQDMEPPKIVTVAGREVPLHSHMNEQFVKTVRMQKALVAGDLDRVRTEAQALLDQPQPERLPSKWAPFIARQRLAAEEIAVATEADALAYSIGAMGAACGECHEALELKFNSKWNPPPAVSAEKREHMRRHQWATDRLWDGLVTGGTEVWRAGAQVFVDDSLAFEDFTAEERQDPHAQNMEDHLHGLGEEAYRTMVTARRGRVYGRLVATCARCHAARRPQQAQGSGL